MIYEPFRDVEQRVSSNIYENIVANLHFHRSVELIYVLRGEMKIKVGVSEKIIKENEIAFVPSYFAHSVDANGETRSITFIIPYNYFSQYVTAGMDLHFFHLDNKEINKQIHNLINDATSELDNQPSLLLQGYINVILGLICKNYKPFGFIHDDNNIMIKIISYIDNNINEKITLDDIAQHFVYSKYYFSRLFNRLFGCNLTYYINQVRMNNLFAHFDKNKKMTAQILDNGFGDISTFYKLKNRKNLQTKK